MNLHYKAISSLPIFKDSIQFYSVFGPSRDLTDSLQITKFPALLGVSPPPADNPEQLGYFGMRIDVKYDDMLQQFLEVTGKKEEFYAKVKAKKVGAERKFVEIRNQ